MQAAPGPEQVRYPAYRTSLIKIPVDNERNTMTDNSHSVDSQIEEGINFYMA